MAADVVGYSRLIEADDEGTRARLRKIHSEMIDPQIASDGGRVVKTIGDGILVEFPSAVDAVRNAIAIQSAMVDRNAHMPEDQRLVFRVGINVGDVIIEDDDIHGDGVNVAARLEGLCRPGEVYIAGTVHDHVEGKLPVKFEDLGERTVKNISKPVRVYRVSPPSGEKPSTTSDAAPLVLPDKPSIAVLPFENMSGDPEQEYFADGITEDIITELSRFRTLFVIARNSSFAFKGKAIGVSEVAQKLGVQFVLEGSVRKAGERVRITAQLIDASTGGHVWADRYDREFTDIFDLQDELTGAIVAVLPGRLEDAGRARSERKRTTNMSAYDFILLGNEHLRRHSREEIAEAGRCYQSAIDLDPDYARAHALLAWTNACFSFRGSWTEPCADAALRSIEKSIALDDDDSWSHGVYGQTLLIRGQTEEAEIQFKRAIALNPNDADVAALWSPTLVYMGRWEEGLEWIDKAKRLNPYPGQWYYWYRGFALFSAREYEQAVRAIKELTPVHLRGHAYLAASYAYLERPDEARKELALFEDACKREKAIIGDHALPSMREVALDWADRYSNPSDREHFLNGLRKAGLPGKPKEADKTLPLPDKPSIAVLPFQNMSGDPEQEYFADGIAEDIITALSRFHWFFVIARNSSFSYKGSSPDIRQVARELGVQYVLEGSVRRGGDRVRITGQLVEAETGRHVWAERYDRKLQDIFAVQDEITEAIAGAVAPALVIAETRRVQRKLPESLDAWDYAMRGTWHLWHLGPSDVAEAKRLFLRAIDIDPNNNVAHSGYAFSLWFEVFFSWTAQPAETMKEAFRAAQQAIATDQNDSWAHAVFGWLHVFSKEFSSAYEACDRALLLNPNLAFAEAVLALAHALDHHPEEMAIHADSAERLSPRDPFTLIISMLARGVSAFSAGDYEMHMTWARRITETTPDYPVGWRHLSVAYGHLGRLEEARQACEKLRNLVPHDSISLARATIPIAGTDHRERFLDGLRKAGLPEN